MEWTENEEGVWNFEHPFNLFAKIWLLYDKEVGGYVFGCAWVGIHVHVCQATTLPAAKAEALTLVTARLKEIVEQLENAPLK